MLLNFKLIPFEKVVMTKTITENLVPLCVLVPRGAKVVGVANANKLLISCCSPLAVFMAQGA